MSSPELRIGSIVIDCDDFDRMMNFWQEALHYTHTEPPANGWIILRDPNGRGPNVSINRTSEGHLEQYRLHLDLYTEDQEGEVKRLIALGATLRVPAKPETDFVELGDPDGNPFCVVQVPKETSKT